MLDVLKDTWERIQDDLRSRAGEAAYDHWLRGLRPLALERGVCYFEAQNRMVCDRVKRLHVPLLADCLTRGFGGAQVSVHIEPVPEAVRPELLEVSPSKPIVDRCNETAFLVLQSLIEGDRELPARQFLFHGPSGVGKTYLLRWWRDLAPARPVLHDGLALRNAFKLKFRDAAVDGLVDELSAARPLAIDGIHRFARHSRAQRALLGVLKLRAELGVPTVLTSRWHPQDTWAMDEGLQSFCLSGFVAELQLPGPKARLQYLRALEGAASRNGRAAAVESMASTVRGSFFDVQAAWAGWVAERNAGTPRAQQHYLRLIDPGRVFRELLERVCQRLDIGQAELLGKGQARRITLGRQALAWLAVREGLSQAEIGRHMCGRTRAAISYSIKTIEKRMVDDPEIRRAVEGLL